MALRDDVQKILGSAWHVASKAFFTALMPAVDGTAEAGKVLTADSSGNVTLPGALRSSGGGVGYGTGAGGTVTQATSKSTGVTLNKLTGQITMNNAALGAGAEVAFTLTNSQIAATDVVVPSIASGGTSASYSVGVTATAAGSCEITLTNLSGGSLGEALVLNFVVLKGVAA